MPKPNGNKKAYSWRNQYADGLDVDCDPPPLRYHKHGGGERRVSFKHTDRDGGHHHGNKRHNGNVRNWSASVQAHLQEEDIDMGAFGGPATSSSGGGYDVKSSRGSRQRRQGPPGSVKALLNRKLVDGPIGFYKVDIPYGANYDKDFIVKMLTTEVEPMVFLPLSWTTRGAAVTFYLDDFKVSAKLLQCNRKLQLPDNFKMIINVSVGFPNVDVNKELRDKMKSAMGRRYNAEHKALDLTRFHTDPEFTNSFCALFKPVVMLSVIDLLAEFIPDLEAIKLDENKLQLFTHMKKMADKLPQLRIVYLKDNKLRDLNHLDSISSLPLTELVLEGNPLCSKFTANSEYVSEVRKKFPKLIKLDNVDLPPPISFDIEDEGKIPPSVQTFLCNPEGLSIVRQFLEQYMLILDGDNRQSLLDAYHENAYFSMTMAYPYGLSAKNSPFLTWYQTENRNLNRITEGERRMKLLKQGKLSIVAFLKDMPATKHDINTFTVDLTVFNARMLVLTATGMFKELRTGHKVTPVRYFHRTMVILPSGSGFCIGNEQLHITNAYPSQAKTAFANPTIEVTPPQPSITPAPALDDNAKQAMIATFSNESTMNLEWSQRCLEETSWDYNKAAHAFAEARTRGVIPPEAFVK